MQTVDNYPAGAFDDPRAPYNENLEKNIDFDFNLLIKGKLSIPYFEEEDLDNKLNSIRSLLGTIPDKISDELWNLGIDSEIGEHNEEVW